MMGSVAGSPVYPKYVHAVVETQVSSERKGNAFTDMSRLSDENKRLVDENEDIVVRERVLNKRERESATIDVI